MRPAAHGRDHDPDGPDPGVTGRWHYVGTTDEPVFESGWTNVGGDSVPMRYRIHTGSPNFVHAGAIVAYAEQMSLEIQGDVTGGADATTVFTIGLLYRRPYDIPYPSHDDALNYVACRLFTDGRFVRGA